MATLTQLRLQDWYSVQIEMQRHTRAHLLKRWITLDLFPN